MDLSVREWICINNACNTTHNRDEAASKNIRAEGIRMLKVASPEFISGVYDDRKADGIAVSASGGSIRQDRARTKAQGNVAPSEARNPIPHQSRYGLSINNLLLACDRH